MYRNKLIGIALTSALVVSPAPGLACGEGSFNAGKGLPFQSYLAPRPATVLIYANPDPSASDSQRIALYAGLQKAGHRLTVVSNADELADALRDKHYDVVITAFDTVDTVAKTLGASTAEASANTTLLPVVARKDRGSVQTSNRFGAVLTNGASLGQYLRTINKLLPAIKL